MYFCRHIAENPPTQLGGEKVRRLGGGNTTTTVKKRKQQKCLSFLFVTISHKICVISGFRRDLDENCALLGYYAASISNF